MQRSTPRNHCLFTHSTSVVEVKMKKLFSIFRSMCYVHARYILTCFHIKCRNGKDPIKYVFLNKSGENALCCGVLAPNG